MSMYLYERFIDATKDEKLIENTIRFLTKEILKENNKTAIIPFGKDRYFYYGIVLKCSISSVSVYGKCAILPVNSQDDNDYFSWKCPVNENGIDEVERCVYENSAFSNDNIHILAQEAKRFSETYIRKLSEEREFLGKYANNTLDLHLTKEK